MAVAITTESIQHTGLAPSIEGSVAAWRAFYEVDGGESIHGLVSISLAGPPTHDEAQQKALELLQLFLRDACEAAKRL
jgi:hypothetical protein